jgi:regulator of protease activity HflC (stomatin/prohibitin superfamily)
MLSFFSKKPMNNPATATASNAEKTHGPFPVQLQITETTNANGVREVEPMLICKTSKGEAVGEDVESLFSDVIEVYSARLKEKMEANTKERARQTQIKSNYNAKQAKIAANRNAKKKEEEHKKEVLQALRNEGRVIRTSSLPFSKLDPANEAVYSRIMDNRRLRATVQPQAATGGTRRRKKSRRNKTNKR